MSYKRVGSYEFENLIKGQAIIATFTVEGLDLKKLVNPEP